ncbi:site-specific integrase [Konateibacter massiliensis]|uniref:site-specific integrase n=1 Tax=Konateibacter massiliensis TaxID=2002841 RepID=UPI0015D4BB99|nr:tyrosine-type recombinase/integrase [Konateibacter massiliensis]
MCYKEEVQRKNAEKLQRKFDEENVPEFIQDFFPRIASRAARINYWSTIKNMLKWLMENNFIKRDKLSDIVSDDIKNIRPAKMISYFEYLKYDKKISLNTLSTQKNQLGSFWEYLKEEHYLDDNIVHMVKSEEFKPAKTNRRKMEKMPLHEDVEEMIEKILRKPDEFIRIRNIMVFRVLRGTGLRESELAGLDIDNLFLEEEHPYILVISKGTYDYSDNGKDIVYLTKDATAALNEWLEYRMELDDIVDSKAIFLNKNGKRMNEENIQNMFKTYSSGKLTPHMMRHEYTTILQRETNDPTFVQEQGRWKSDKVMRSVYDSGASRSLGKLANM